MKHSIIISVIVVAITAILATGCTNKEAKAQALLVEAISYSDGNAPSNAAQNAALALAETKGFKPAKDANGLSQREVVMVAGRILCDRVIAEYPGTQATLKAAELKQQINDRLRVLGNERIQSLFHDSY